MCRWLRRYCLNNKDWMEVVDVFQHIINSIFFGHDSLVFYRFKTVAKWVLIHIRLAHGVVGIAMRVGIRCLGGYLDGFRTCRTVFFNIGLMYSVSTFMPQPFSDVFAKKKMLRMMEDVD